MNILIVSPYAINAPHFETELEIAQNHINDGDFVKILYCNAELLACDVNPDHNITKCLICINRRKRGLRLLSKEVDVGPLTNMSEANKFNLALFMKLKLSNVEDLKKITFDNFDIGYAALSSLISLTRDPHTDLNKYNDLARRFISSSFVVFSSINEYLSTGFFDKVYVYNGRYGPMRAVYRACQKNNVECLLVERGCTLNHYSISVNKLSHDIRYTNDVINETWENEHDHDRRDELANTFYMNPINKISPTWIAFTVGQINGLLPNDWNIEKENIVIFTTSEDEYSAIGDVWEHKIYINQIDGIRKILDALQYNSKFHVYLRIHPNQKNISNKNADSIINLKSPQLTVIQADSQISSYTLMQKATKVITFGSTAGIEAAYWGVPSILVGPSLYQHLGSTYNPHSHEEVIEMIINKLTPKDKEGAQKYGFYIQTFGIPFKYYKAIKIKKGTFKNVQLSKNFFLLVMYVVMRIIRPLDRFVSLIAIKRLENNIYCFNARR